MIMHVSVRRSRSRELHNCLSLLLSVVQSYITLFNVLMREIEGRKETEITAMLNNVMSNDI